MMGYVAGFPATTVLFVCNGVSLKEFTLIGGAILVVE
jgi:hypothetical protein